MVACACLFLLELSGCLCLPVAARVEWLPVVACADSDMDRDADADTNTSADTELDTDSYVVRNFRENIP